jgi:beta-glucosidase
MPFPHSFTWGAATSAYQIEGGATQGGRGRSVWDSFCRTPGAVHLDQNGDTACDHYNRWRDDVDLMSGMGLRAYRFSISWARVFPEGTGALNAPGLDFYDRLVDGLLAANIRPFATLFHWDYPEALYLRGGWLNRDSVGWFADYAATVVDRLSDRVRDWMTLNEPQCFLKFGHGDGRNAPGLRLPLPEQLLAGHHVLMAHGAGVRAIRAHARSESSVGWAPVAIVKMPATVAESAAEVEAARRAMFSVTKPDLWNNTWFADPIVLGRYPEDGLALYGSAAPAIRAGDMELIQQPLDFFGVNIYEGERVRQDASGAILPVSRVPGHPTTAFGWPVEPDSLYWGPRFIHERYRLPVYVTENGYSGTDWVSLDGKVHDPQRIDFTRRYLMALRRAIEDGADVRGYFHWSLLDNFEWSEGYKQRFGLVHVDFGTLERTPKDSAEWYAQVIRTNGAGLAQT